jgi:hypothetical protein
MTFIPHMEINLTSVIWRLSAGCSAAEGNHRLLTDLRDITGNTAYCNFWIENTCFLKYPCEMMCCTFVVRQPNV